MLSAFKPLLCVSTLTSVVAAVNQFHGISINNLCSLFIILNPLCCFAAYCELSVSFNRGVNFLFFVLFVVSCNVFKKFKSSFYFQKTCNGSKALLNLRFMINRINKINLIMNHHIRKYSRQCK